MAIKGRVGIPAVAVGVGATTLVDGSSLGVERYAISGMTFNNTTGASIDITITDGTTQIDSFSVDLNESAQSAIIGQGYLAATDIEATASAVGVNASTTVTTYDGGD